MAWTTKYCRKHQSGQDSRLGDFPTCPETPKILSLGKLWPRKTGFSALCWCLVFLATTEFRLEAVCQFESCFFSSVLWTERIFRDALVFQILVSEECEICRLGSFAFLEFACQKPDLSIFVLLANFYSLGKKLNRSVSFGVNNDTGVKHSCIL